MSSCVSCESGSIQEDRHKVEQFYFLWNSSTFFGSCDPKAEQLYKKVEQFYKKVEQVLKAGHSFTNVEQRLTCWYLLYEIRKE